MACHDSADSNHKTNAVKTVFSKKCCGFIPTFESDGGLEMQIFNILCFTLSLDFESYDYMM